MQWINWKQLKCGKIKKKVLMLNLKIEFPTKNQNEIQFQILESTVVNEIRQIIFDSPFPFLTNFDIIHDDKVLKDDLVLSKLLVQSAGTTDSTPADSNASGLDENSANSLVVQVVFSINWF